MGILSNGTKRGVRGARTPFCTKFAEVAQELSSKQCWKIDGFNAWRVFGVLVPGQIHE